jgi:flagellar protein FlgJ
MQRKSGLTPVSAERNAATLAPVTPSQRRSVGSAVASAQAQATPSGDHRDTFVGRVLEHAKAAAETLGVPIANVVGQAALESGWGRHEIQARDGTQSHNLFGIKAGANWTGKTVDAVTTEVIGGVARRVVQKFRAYDNYTDAFNDYAKLLTSSNRYKDRVVGAADPVTFAKGLQKGGYATDPAYATKLAGTIASARRVVDRVAVSEMPERLA